MNSIEELTTRGDLLDRAILLSLPTIPEGKHQDEKTFWRTFAGKRPQILGALLNAVSTALRHLPSVTLNEKPRMADFALWSCAAAPACGWTAEGFMRAYQGARTAAYDLTLEASTVAPLVRALVEKQSPWQGTASALLTELTALAEEKTTKQNTWPKNGRVLSNALRRLAPTLRAVGVHITFGERTGKQGQRQIVLSRITEERETLTV